MPRKSQIAVEATPYYHCVSRCVRRAFLCGKDRFTGRSFEHRRTFIESELLRLGQIFFLDVVAFTVMSNHFHVLLFIDQTARTEASTLEVVTRWHQIHQGNAVSTKFLNNEPLDPHERQQLDLFIDVWRDRLASISWYMRVLNEKVARLANAEDDVTGRFWEGRFKCQALLDEQALLSCMAYIDLNPVRAAMAATPEQSDHTSVQHRIRHWKQGADNQSDSNAPTDHPDHALQPSDLHPFIGNHRLDVPTGIIFTLVDYLELVDWTGRQIREDKVGSITTEAKPILQRLSISPEHWVYLCTNFESKFKGLVGSVHSLEQACQQFNRTRRPNFSASSKLFT